MKSDFLAIVSLLGAVTAQQENIAWWLQQGATLVAIVAGLVTIYLKLRPQPPKE